MVSTGGDRILAFVIRPLYIISFLLLGYNGGDSILNYINAIHALEHTKLMKRKPYYRVIRSL